MSAHGVEITGMGIVSAIGHDTAAFSHSLFDGQSGISRLFRQNPTELPVAIGAEIADFSYPALLQNIVGQSASLHKSALHAARRSPFAIQASVIAALQAWQEAQLEDADISPERVGLVIAGHNTTQNLHHARFSDFQKHPEYLSPRYALQFMDSDQIGVLSEILGIQGEAFVAGAASASGNTGILQGSRLVQAGLIDICLVVGVVADLSPMEHWALHSLGALGGKSFRDHPEAACRPFDTQHEGFIYGQASACLVLEATQSAERRQVTPLARILGGASALHATASPAPQIAGEVRAMAAALRHSGVLASDIDYVNTHGSSSPSGDRTEIAALEQLFGDHFPDVWLNATKGLTGHCLWSAGVVEAIAAVLQMRHGYLHGNVNLENPISATARFCGAASVPERVRTVMSNAFGFGGINTSIVLQRCD